MLTKKKHSSDVCIHTCTESIQWKYLCCSLSDLGQSLQKSEIQATVHRKILGKYQPDITSNLQDTTFE